MNNRSIIIVLVVLIIILLGAVGYLLTQPTQNLTLNITNNTTTTVVQNQSNSTSNSTVKISAAQATSIASQYIASHPDQFANAAAGNPSLNGGIYYVPVIETGSNDQNPKGTVIAYIKVDGATGNVLGIQSISMQ
jgi:hypothetical protein